MRNRYAALLLALCGSAPIAYSQEFPTTSSPVSVSAVAPAANFIDSLYVNQWLGLDADGAISGKLIGLSDTGEPQPRPAVEVALVNKGQVVASTVSEADGSFKFARLSPGTYTFVAKSDFTFATLGLNVMPASSGSASSFEVCAASMPFARAQQIIRENWVPSTTAAVAGTYDADPLGKQRAFAMTTKIRLKDGQLTGRASRAGLPLNEQDLTGLVAHVFRGERSVASGPVAGDGSFKIDNVAPGVYSLVVVGKAGTAVVGFEAVDADAVTSTAKTVATRFVQVDDPLASINIELAETPTNPPQEEVPPMIVEEAVMGPPADFIGGPVVGGGFAGPGGFAGGGGLGGAGGGGAGGIGGIGGLLGIAGLAVGVAALGDDDDFNPPNATIIVP